MHDSSLIRQQLEDAVAEMSPAARAVFDARTSGGDGPEPELSGDFDALTPPDKAIVSAAVDLWKQLADAEVADHRAETLARRHRRFWIASVLYSLTCLVASAAVLVHVYTAPTKPDPADTVVTTPEEAARYVTADVAPPATGAEPAISIPTGLYITLVEFDGPYTVEITGQIWQRYADDLPEDLTEGIFLPEAKDQPQLTEVYRERRNNEEVVGWTFRVTLRQPFDYSKYPLGRHQIRLRMWHPDFERNVSLIPDLQSYPSTDPAALPGVDPDLVLEKWDLQEAFFSYRIHDFKADFSAPTLEHQYPELNYSLAVRRHLVTPLISRGIAPTVVLIQLFLIVMVLSKDERRLRRFDITPGTVIFIGAAFLFALLLSHNGLREEVQASGLTYLGYLYVITYVMIVAVVLNAVLIVGRPDLKLFRKYDNLLVRLMFGPVIASTVLVVTLLTFCN